MNDDDFEERLAEWRPADPPPDLLRRLRAARPPTRMQRVRPSLAGLFGGGFWPRTLACAGALAALTLILAVRQTPPPRFPGSAGRPLNASDGGVAATQPTAPPPSRGETDADAAGDHLARSRSDELGDFANSGLRYAVLNVGPNVNLVSGFHLDAPPGPMRLDCGYTLPGDELNNAHLGRFRLDVRDHF